MSENDFTPNDINTKSSEEKKHQPSSTTETNHMTIIFMTGNLLPITKNTDEKNSVVMLSVVKKFDNQVKNIIKPIELMRKSERQIYNFIIAQLVTKRNTLLKQTQRARNIYKFILERIGIDKIKYITTYTANSIAELSDNQIQTIINHFTEKTNMEFSDNPEDHNEDNSNLNTNQINASEMRTNILIPAVEYDEPGDDEYDEDAFAESIRKSYFTERKGKTEKMHEKERTNKTSESSSDFNSDSDYDEQIHVELMHEEIARLEALEAIESQPDIDFSLDDEIINHKPDDIKLFDGIDFDLDNEIVNSNHPINVRTERILVQV
ncbi:hypothetical protein RhiirA4_485471 [Rhizophagus irregularis]|uniref:Uncharacterized protein n=1 Tax=Rhizophagus irregularis TaxID=588596 RepID=A0A2I1HQ61_9GLOM|nr:hypothetical protein RhiirA4_485471 [Rhizophagus irregularis]